MRFELPHLYRNGKGEVRRQQEIGFWLKQARSLQKQLPWLTLVAVSAFASLLAIDFFSLEGLTQNATRATNYAPGRLIGLFGAIGAYLLGFIPASEKSTWSHLRLFVLCCSGTLAIAHASLVTYLAGGSPGTFPVVNFVVFVAFPLPTGWAATGALGSAAVFISGLVSDGAFQKGGFEAAANTLILLGLVLLLRDFLNRREFREFLTLQQLQAAREQTEKLLLGVLPRKIVDELKETGYSKPRLQADATVLFADLVSFSRYAAHLPPDELVHRLDGLFSAFDNITREHGLEKLKTIGDCYMAAGGLLNADPDHTAKCVMAALDMAEVARLQEPVDLPDGKQIPVAVRVGVHCGPVVAGIIGKEKFLFDIWGDTVNIASRIESLGTPGQVTVSREVFERIQDTFHCTDLGTRVAKHELSLKLWSVDGKKVKVLGPGSGNSQ